MQARAGVGSVGAGDPLERPRGDRRGLVSGKRRGWAPRSLGDRRAGCDSRSGAGEGGEGSSAVAGIPNRRPTGTGTPGAPRCREEPDGRPGAACSLAAAAARSPARHLPRSGKESERIRGLLFFCVQVRLDFAKCDFCLFVCALRAAAGGMSCPQSWALSSGKEGTWSSVFCFVFFKIPVEWAMAFAMDKGRGPLAAFYFLRGPLAHRGSDSWHRNFRCAEPCCGVRCAGAAWPLARTLCLRSGPRSEVSCCRRWPRAWPIGRSGCVF